ncbi:MAG: ABC transporter permease [Bacteroidales bacterium]|nr:ABC transporter permease [Bacteroidales bacterium]MDT8430286.1 ABC transporter permease [Bacteroidales bacterium]
MTGTGISPGRLAWIRFRSNPVSLAGLVFILLAVLVSVAGYIISPDKTIHANTQVLEIALEKPGFTCDFLRVTMNSTREKKGFMARLFTGKHPRQVLVPMHSYHFEADQVVVLEYSKYKEDRFYSSYYLADVLFPVDMSTYTFADGLYSVKSVQGDQEFSGSIASLRLRVEEEHIFRKRFLLGTDRFGRDMLSRMILGTRVSLSVGFIAVLISLVVGVLLGGIAGYFRGWIDKVIMWLVNVVWSVPTLLMVISITLVLGKGYWQVFVAVGLTMWVEVARVVRGQVLSVREKEYVEAARVIGMRPGRILFRHIIPNVLSPVIIISAANFATAILLEAGLSFLGIGVQPPVPTWGGMIKDHYGFIIVNLGYLAFIPGIAIMLMVLAFTLAGNGLRDALDSRQT